MSITNIVATSDLSCQFELKQLAEILGSAATIKPSRIKALTYKFRSGGSCRLFANGKINLLGTKTEQSCLSTFQEFANILSGLGYDLNVREPKIVNVAGVCNLERAVNLPLLFGKSQHCAQFNPEIFPALNLKLDRITFLIFSSGKVVITGCSSCAVFLSSAERIKNHVNALLGV